MRLISDYATKLWLAVMLLVSAVLHGETTKIVDFRDGTVLRLELPEIELPWRRIATDGEVTDDPVSLAEVQQLRFVLTPATEQVAAVRRMVVQLGADDYYDREKAQKELILRGAKFRQILEQMQPRADPEVKWRLNAILKQLPEGESLVGNDYDQLQLKGVEEEIHGDVGNWSLRANYRGAEILLDRSSVLAIRDAPLDLDLSAEPTVVHMDRIARDDDSAFPDNVVRVDFDKGPKGEALAVGTDISEVYVALGCIFSTSVEGSFVGIQPYNVGGRSGKFCAANHKPLYQGTLTVKFCKPGNARLPAGVKYVGFWTSHVSVDGTILQAFDARNRMIAEIRTAREQRDFLAMSTNIPIAYIKIVPDVDIDPDFAIDDLVFDAPKPLSEAGDPDRFSVVLTSGERLYSAGLQRSGEQVRLEKLTVGADVLELTADEIAVFVPPRGPVPEVEEKAHCFIRTTDGSVLRAKNNAELTLLDFPERKVMKSQLVALWGSETTLEEPRDSGWTGGGLLVAKADEYLQLGSWQLGEKWIEAENLPADDAKFTYATSPSVWFQKPAKRASASGLLRTVNGQEIVLHGEYGFQLKSWSDQGVTLVNGEHEWTLPLTQVSSLLMPKKDTP